MWCDMRIGWKLFDKNIEEIINNTNYVIACDGGVRRVSKAGELTGTLQNRHLIPLLASGRVDINNKEIVYGHIVEQIGHESEIGHIGYVSYFEGTWYVVNDKEKQTTRLYDLEHLEIIGHVLKNNILNKRLGI